MAHCCRKRPRSSGVARTAVFPGVLTPVPLIAAGAAALGWTSSPASGSRGSFSGFAQAAAKIWNEISVDIQANLDRKGSKEALLLGKSLLMSSKIYSGLNARTDA